MVAAAVTEGTWWQALFCQALCHMETLLPPPFRWSGATAQAGFLTKPRVLFTPF